MDMPLDLEDSPDEDELQYMDVVTGQVVRVVEVPTLDSDSDTVPAELASAMADVSEDTDEGDSEGMEARSENGDAEVRELATRHTYLGEIDDLEGSAALLEDDFPAVLPLLALDGVVVMPGDTLPLRLVHRAEKMVVERALAAPPPLTRLVAVVCVPWREGGNVSLAAVGCSAELRKLRRHADGTINCIARGRQRLGLQQQRDQRELVMDLRVAVRTLPDPLPRPLPREAAAGLTHWAPVFLRRCDAFHLARRARSLFADMAPQVREFCGGPLALSYWLASNLPLGDDTRQKLLEADSAAERLLGLIGHLQLMAGLLCRACNARVASARDVVRMSDEGCSGAFVNSHGFVHDMVTVRRMGRGRCALQGEPESQHTWFPGYAWTVAYCSTCWQHLGWRFTAVDPARWPQEFWGLRRSAISEGWLRTREPRANGHWE